MQAVSNALADVCVAGATLGVLGGLTAAMLVLRFNSASPVRQTSDYPAVSVLKPLHGNEPGLFSRLASFCRQNYSGAIQLLCGTQLEKDPAAEVVELLAATQSQADVDLVIDTREHGSNPKLSNLINMQGAARHDILVISDSDIVVGPDFLARAISELQRPGVGGVTCAYFGVAAGGVWSQLCALQINSHFLPNVITALSFDAARPCFGAAIVLRRNMLERIGGLAAFADDLADDFAIGKAIRATGKRVVVPHFLVGHVCCERDFRSLWNSQMRWARTIRTIDPIGHLGTVLTHPLPLALFAGGLGIRHSILLVVAALLSRFLVCSTVARVFGLPRQPYWLVPLHDLISFAVFAGSFAGFGVVWRGHSYQIATDGALERD
jgi:ceramide glucosyltransferase